MKNKLQCFNDYVLLKAGIIGVFAFLLLFTAIKPLNTLAQPFYSGYPCVTSLTTNYDGCDKDVNGTFNGDQIINVNLASHNEPGLYVVDFKLMRASDHAAYFYYGYDGRTGIPIGTDACGNVTGWTLDPIYPFKNRMEINVDANHVGQIVLKYDRIRPNLYYADNVNGTPLGAVVYDHAMYAPAGEYVLEIYSIRKKSECVYVSVYGNTGYLVSPTDYPSYGNSITTQNNGKVDDKRNEIYPTVDYTCTYLNQVKFVKHTPASINTAALAIPIDVTRYVCEEDAPLVTVKGVFNCDAPTATQAINLVLTYKLDNVTKTYTFTSDNGNKSFPLPNNLVMGDHTFQAISLTNSWGCLTTFAAPESNVLTFTITPKPQAFASIVNDPTICKDVYDASGYSLTMLFNRYVKAVDGTEIGDGKYWPNFGSYHQTDEGDYSLHYAIYDVGPNGDVNNPVVPATDLIARPLPVDQDPKPLNSTYSSQFQLVLTLNTVSAPVLLAPGNYAIRLYSLSNYTDVDGINVGGILTNAKVCTKNYSSAAGPWVDYNFTILPKPSLSGISMNGAFLCQGTSSGSFTVGGLGTGYSLFYTVGNSAFAGGYTGTVSGSTTTSTFTKTSFSNFYTGSSGATTYPIYGTKVIDSKGCTFVPTTPTTTQIGGLTIVPLPNIGGMRPTPDLYRIREIYAGRPVIIFNNLVEMGGGFNYEITYDVFTGTPTTQTAYQTGLKATATIRDDAGSYQDAQFNLVDLPASATHYFVYVRSILCTNSPLPQCPRTFGNTYVIRFHVNPMPAVTLVPSCNPVGVTFTITGLLPSQPFYGYGVWSDYKNNNFLIGSNEQADYLGNYTANIPSTYFTTNGLDISQGVTLTLNGFRAYINEPNSSDWYYRIHSPIIVHSAIPAPMDFTGIIMNNVSPTHVACAGGSYSICEGNDLSITLNGTSGPEVVGISYLLKTNNGTSTGYYGPFTATVTKVSVNTYPVSYKYVVTIPNSTISSVPAGVNGYTLFVTELRNAANTCATVYNQSVTPIACKFVSFNVTKTAKVISVGPASLCEGDDYAYVNINIGTLVIDAYNVTYTLTSGNITKTVGLDYSDARGYFITIPKTDIISGTGLIINKLQLVGGCPMIYTGQSTATFTIINVNPKPTLIGNPYLENFTILPGADAVLNVHVPVTPGSGLVDFVWNMSFNKSQVVWSWEDKGHYVPDVPVSPTTAGKGIASFNIGAGATIGSDPVNDTHMLNNGWSLQEIGHGTLSVVAIINPLTGCISEYGIDAASTRAVDFVISNTALNAFNSCQNSGVLVELLGFQNTGYYYYSYYVTNLNGAYVKGSPIAPITSIDPVDIQGGRFTIANPGLALGTYKMVLVGLQSFSGAFLSYNLVDEFTVSGATTLNSTTIATTCVGQAATATFQFTPAGTYSVSYILTGPDGMVVTEGVNELLVNGTTLSLGNLYAAGNYTLTVTSIVAGNGGCSPVTQLVEKTFNLKGFTAPTGVDISRISAGSIATATLTGLATGTYTNILYTVNGVIPMINGVRATAVCSVDANGVATSFNLEGSSGLAIGSYPIQITSVTNSTCPLPAFSPINGTLTVTGPPVVTGFTLTTGFTTCAGNDVILTVGGMPLSTTSYSLRYTLGGTTYTKVITTNSSGNATLTLSGLTSGGTLTTIDIAYSSGGAASPIVRSSIIAINPALQGPSLTGMTVTSVATCLTLPVKATITGGFLATANTYVIGYRFGAGTSRTIETTTTTGTTSVTLDLVNPGAFAGLLYIESVKVKSDCSLTTTSSYSTSVVVGDLTVWNVWTVGQPASWSCGTPTSTRDAYIYADYNSASGELVAKNLTIKQGVTLTLAASAWLTVYNNLNLDGTLLIKSPTTGDGATGSLIVKGSIVKSVTGVSKIERFFSDATHYMGTPITQNANISDVTFVNKTAIKTAGSTTNFAGQLVPLTCYQINYAIGKTDLITFNGDFNQSIYYAPNMLAGSTANNYVANPYQSSLDYDAIYNDPANTVGGVKVLKNYIYKYMANGTNKMYIVGSTTVVGGRYIAPLQGFIAKNNLATATSFTINNNVARVHNNVDFHQKLSAMDYNSIRLTVESGDVTDETYVVFDKSFSNAAIDQTDVPKMNHLYAELPMVYTTVNGEKIGYNQLNTLTENTVIPVGFEMGKNGTSSITIDANIQPGLTILLEDKVTGTLTKMNGNTYTFTHSTLYGANRFALHFVSKNSSTMGITENVNANIYSFGKDIFVDLVGNIAGESLVSIYNVQGSLVLTSKMTSTSGKFNLKAVSGAYLVKVVVGNKEFTSKVFVE